MSDPTLHESGFITRLSAELRPENHRPALIERRGGQDKTCTWAELCAAVGAARSALRALGLQPKDRVALIAPNSIAWVAADLAMLCEGLIGVPLFERQSTAELGTILRDCDPSLVLVGHADLGAQLSAEGISAPILEVDALRRSSAVHTEPVARAPHALCTLIYTSGTSGHAKGVMLARRHFDFMLPRTSAALDEVMQGCPDLPERVLHYLPFCFAGSRLLMWTSLLRGAVLHLCTDIQRLGADLKAVRPHYVLNVPKLLERILAQSEAAIAAKQPWLQRLWAQGHAVARRRAESATEGSDALQHWGLDKLLFAPVRRHFGGALRALICGSAALHPDTQAWYARIGIPVYQVYGLTESTGIISMDRPGQVRTGYVGTALPGVETRIDSAGELWTRGPHVFAGYWNNDAASAAVMHPEGWMRTGDLAAQDEVGRLRIVGRAKHVLVPTSGHNIAPEPIEAVIRAQLPPDVHVLLCGHGRPFLTVLVNGPVSDIQVKNAIAHANTVLPAHHRVRAWHVTPECLTVASGLLTANLKVRRDAVEQAFAKELDALYDAESAQAGSQVA